MRVGDCFSGIGGFSLASRWIGWTTAWFSEVDPWCSSLLRHHWPDVPNLGDIRTIDWSQVEPVDLLCGGFPCQPFSSASRGRRTGTADDRWLWPQMSRAVAALRPAWVVGENVTHLDGLGLEQVVSDLEGLGYQTQTLEIPACAVGHDHRRSRLWILAHADYQGEPSRTVHAEVAELSRGHRDPGSVGGEDGLSPRMDRLRGLGNAIAPRVAYQIFRGIAAQEQRMKAVA
jgi:DNA (cytosine-5)-methyltransferase 1